MLKTLAPASKRPHAAVSVHGTQNSVPRDTHCGLLPYPRHRWKYATVSGWLVAGLTAKHDDDRY